MVLNATNNCRNVTLIGPVPFLIRIAKPDTYEAAVNKYMLLEKCDKITAMANMVIYRHMYKQIFIYIYVCQYICATFLTNLYNKCD